MLDIRFIRENPELVRENIKKKFQDTKLPLVDEVLELDEKKRAAITEASELRAQRNTLSKQVGMLMGQAKKDPSKLEEAEAIKASHENLRLLARKAQKTFGSGLLNVGYLAACVRDNYAYKRQQLYLTNPAWEPVFEPDAAMLSGIGDGIGKINQAVPGYFGTTNLRDMTGVDPES